MISLIKNRMVFMIALRGLYTPSGFGARLQKLRKET